MNGLILCLSAFWCGGDESGLGSEDFEVREATTQRLRGYPVGAIPLLLNALSSRDPEVRRRADILTSHHRNPLNDPRMALLLRCENDWQVRAAPLLWEKKPLRPDWPDYVGFSEMCKREGLLTLGTALVGDGNEEMYYLCPMSVDSDIQLMRERFIRYKYR